MFIFAVVCAVLGKHLEYSFNIWSPTSKLASASLVEGADTHVDAIINISLSCVADRGPG
jgi:hypothetical protein